EVFASASRGDGEGRHRPDRHDAPVVETTVGARPLLPYFVFTEQLPSIPESRLNDVVANVVRIVEVEGPVLGHRVHQAYREAYGGQRIGRDIARHINHAISLAERRGHIVSSNPLNDRDIRGRTLRLPSQPEVQLRELGPRPLDMVPAAELAHHLAEFWAGDEILLEDDLFRAVLEVLGLKRLTDNAKSVLRSTMPLVQGDET